MPPIWKPKDPELLKSWVEAIIAEASDELTMWETKFIEDMQTRLNHGWPLTQSQEEKLEQIYAERTS